MGVKTARRASALTSWLRAIETRQWSEAEITERGVETEAVTPNLPHDWGIQMESIRDGRQSSLRGTKVGPNTSGCLSRKGSIMPHFVILFMMLAQPG